MDGEPFERLEDSQVVVCPYCGEGVEILVDPSGGASQEYVEDCEICCRPWRVRVSVDRTGGTNVWVTT